MEKETQKEIERIENFTNSYWKPLLNEALKNGAPSTPDIIEGIIKNRVSYVNALKSYIFNPTK